MGMFLSIASVILALLGAYIVIMNCACIVISLRNQHRCIDRHHSSVLFVGQLLLCASGYFSPIIPRWLLWSAALADISLWYMLLFLVRLPFRRRSPPIPPNPE